MTHPTTKDDKSYELDFRLYNIDETLKAFFSKGHQETFQNYFTKRHFSESKYENLWYCLLRTQYVESPLTDSKRTEAIKEVIARSAVLPPSDRLHFLLTSRKFSSNRVFGWKNINLLFKLLEKSPEAVPFF